MRQLLNIVCGMSVVLAVVSAARAQRTTPVVQITVGRQTTYCVDAPLHPDGTVNYVAYLNGLLGEGVTASNNAAVPLFGVQEWSDSAKRQRAAKALGLASAPPKPVPWVELEAYVWAHAPKEKLARKVIVIPAQPEDVEAIKKLDLPEDVRREMLESLAIVTTEAEDEARSHYWTATNRPWTRREFPLVAGFVNANRETLDVLRKAAKRPRCFIPYSDETDSAGVLAHALPGFGMKIRLLLPAAMRKAGDNDFDGAWEDLTAMHRLGRLFRLDHGVAWRLLGAHIRRDAYRGELSLVASGELPAELARKRLAALRQLDALKDLSGSNSRIDRIGTLDAVMQLARSTDVMFRRHFARANLPPAVRAKIDFDWDTILRKTNDIYDRVDAAWQADGFGAKREALKAVEAHVGALGRQARKWEKRGGYDAYLRGLLGKGAIDFAQVRDDLTEAFANELISVTFSSTEGLLALRFEAIAYRRLAMVALAVTAYTKDNQRPPKALADLTPVYLDAVPLDPFSGRPLIYRRTARSALVYSVGPNLEDDTARDGEDDIAWSTK